MHFHEPAQGQVPFKTCLLHDLHHTYTLMPIANMQCDLNKERGEYTLSRNLSQRAGHVNMF